MHSGGLNGNGLKRWACFIALQAINTKTLPRKIWRKLPNLDSNSALCDRQQQQDRKHKASHQKQPHQQVQPLALRRLLDQRQHNSSTRGHSSKRRLLGATDRSLTDGIYRVKVRKGMRDRTMLASRFPCS
eukprot:1158451-Pelagomonas_calceolata.AAC.3